MDLKAFITYVYTYYLLATSFKHPGNKPDQWVCQFFEALIRESDSISQMRSKKTYYFREANVLRLVLTEIRPLLMTHMEDRHISHAISAFSPKRNFYDATTRMVSRTLFKEWKARPIPRTKHSIEQYLSSENTRAILTFDTGTFVEYKGAVIAVHPLNCIWFCISDNSEVLEKISVENKCAREKGELLFGPDEREGWVKDVLGGVYDEPEPQYWFGADVTSLIDADSRVARTSPLIIKPPTLEEVLKAPENQERFRDTVTILTNKTGIHCPSTKGFPKDPTPLMRLWKEKAEYWEARQFVDPMKPLERYDTTTLSKGVIQYFRETYSNNDLTRLARVSAMQINNRHDMATFWNARNTPNDIAISYEILKQTSDLNPILDKFGEFDFPIADDIAARETGLPPVKFGIGWATWSYAKGYVNANDYPKGVRYRLAWQRRKCVAVRLKNDLSEKRSVLIPPDTEDLPQELFPWGAILDNLYMLIEMGQCDAWHYSLLRDLRKYTINKLDSLSEELTKLKIDYRSTSARKRVWPRAVYKRVEEFISNSPLKLEPPILPLNRRLLGEIPQKSPWLLHKAQSSHYASVQLAAVLRHHPKFSSRWLRGNDPVRYWRYLLQEAIVRSGQELNAFIGVDFVVLKKHSRVPMK